jgi:hypothetical protein
LVRKVSSLTRAPRFAGWISVIEVLGRNSRGNAHALEVGRAYPRGDGESGKIVENKIITARSKDGCHGEPEQTDLNAFGKMEQLAPCG